jgi:hypothetical protein
LINGKIMCMHLVFVVIASIHHPSLIANDHS